MREFAQKQIRPQPETLFSSLPGRAAANQPTRLMQDETAPKTSSRFAHSFAGTPVRTGSNEPGAPFLNNMQASGSAPIGLPEPIDTAPRYAHRLKPQKDVERNVGIPAHIQSSSTPVEMQNKKIYRIPPRVDTPVKISIIRAPAPDKPIVLSVEGAAGANGMATVNGQDKYYLRNSEVVQLRGVEQTAPGNGGNLQLVARQAGTRLAASAGFSVSSVPQNWSISFKGLVTGARRGIEVINKLESDSGDVKDLNMVMRSEKVELGAGTGCFEGFGGNTSGYRAITTGLSEDDHSAPGVFLTGKGKITAEQTFVFKDNRTGALDIPARNSGFQIKYDVTESTPGAFFLTVTKTGAASTAHGVSSAAGSGTATGGPQPV